MELYNQNFTGTQQTIGQTTEVNDTDSTGSHWGILGSGIRVWSVNPPKALFQVRWSPLKPTKHLGATFHFRHVSRSCGYCWGFPILTTCQGLFMRRVLFGQMPIGSRGLPGAEYCTLKSLINVIYLKCYWLWRFVSGSFTVKHSNTQKKETECRYSRRGSFVEPISSHPTWAVCAAAAPKSFIRLSDKANRFLHIAARQPEALILSRLS